jgi:hypothetical protein
MAGLAAALVTLTLGAREAHAAKIPIFYQTGEDIFVAGDGKLPAPFDKHPELTGAQAGYKCDIFGLFGAYIYIKGCAPVAFKGDSFWADPEIATAVGKAHPEDSMQVGAWKKHGRWLLGLVLIGGLAFAGIRKMKGGGD